MIRGYLLFTTLCFGFATSAYAERVEIPLQVGLGPALYWLPGVVDSDGASYAAYGLSLDAAAIIDRATIQKNKKRIPRKYRSALKNVHEVRIGKLWVPDHLFLSFGVDGVSMAGASWRPISLGLPLSRTPRIALEAGLLLTYAYLEQESREGESVQTTITHFARPGVDIGLDVEIPFGRHVLLGLGAATAFYIPQTLGQFGYDSEDPDIMWNIHRAFAMLKIRFPYRANL